MVLLFLESSKIMLLKNDLLSSNILEINTSAINTKHVLRPRNWLRLYHEGGMSQVVEASPPSG